jgi:uncharacterized membrane protein YoaK (UPF0700 family)
MSPTAAQSLSRAATLRAYTFAGVAGYLDAHALMRFHVYASFMSGNTTRAGVNSASGHWSAAEQSLLAIGSFVIGAFVGVALLHSPHGRGATLAVALALALLAICAAVEVLRPSLQVSVALLSLSMGALNATMSRIGGQSINIGYVSGGLHKLAEHLAFAYYGFPVELSQGPTDTHLRRAAVLARVWGVFLLGAVVGAVIEGRFPAFVLAIPASALLAVLALGSVDAERQRHPLEASDTVAATELSATTIS